MTKLGCFRPVLFGCLGILAIVVIGLIVVSLFAMKGIKSERVEDMELAAVAETVAELPGELGGVETMPPGRVVLELAQGEFYVHRGEPGEGVKVTARFDQEAYELADGLETLEDGSWIYRVSYKRTIPGLQAILQSVFGGNTDSRVDIYLPPDVPIALELYVEQGASEIELGGLWLTDAMLSVSKGGFELQISEPLREPIERFVLDGSMGGVDVGGIGNASPRTLVVDWRMGGANIDLSGQWVRDCDASVSVNMGSAAPFSRHMPWALA